MVGPNVVIADGVTIGPNVVIYANSRIERGAQIQEFATVGKPSVRGLSSGDSDELTVVGEAAVIGSHAIVYAGARLAERAFMADNAVMRDQSRLGFKSLIGAFSSIGVRTTVGDRVSIQAYSGIAQRTVIEDDVFVGPFVLAANDNSLARHDDELPAIRLRRACRIGGSVQINPGIDIGEEAFIAAKSLITRDVSSRAKMLGVPARQIGEVADEELLEQWR